MPIFFIAKLSITQTLCHSKETYVIPNRREAPVRNLLSALSYFRSRTIPASILEPKPDLETNPDPLL